MIDATRRSLWNECYDETFTNQCRYHILKGARYSGKSRHIAQYLLTVSYEEPGIRMAALRFNYSDCKDSVYQEILDVIRDWHLEDDFKCGEGPKAKPHIQNIKTGSEIIFKGVKENLKSLAGVSLSLIHISEPTRPY